MILDYKYIEGKWGFSDSFALQILNQAIWLAFLQRCKIANIFKLFSFIVETRIMSPKLGQSGPLLLLLVSQSLLGSKVLTCNRFFNPDQISILIQLTELFYWKRGKKGFRKYILSHYQCEWFEILFHLSFLE